jgi:GcrA cell cycle regulator
VTEDMQAIAAGMWVSGASMTQIAVAVGSNRNIVAGRIMRLRAAGDDRWPPRPRPSREETKQHRLEYDRQRYRREHPSAVRRVAEAVAPIVEPVVLRPATRPRNLLLIDTPWDGCRWSTGEAPDGRLLFCGAPQENGKPYCPHHAELARGNSGSGRKFVLRARLTC